MAAIETLVIWNAVVATCLAIIVLVVSKAGFLQNRPGIRHGLWLLVLAKLVIPSVVPVGILPSNPAGEITSSQIMQEHGVAPSSMIAALDNTLKPNAEIADPNIAAREDLSQLEPGSLSALFGNRPWPPSFHVFLLAGSLAGSCTLGGLAIHRARCVGRVLAGANADSGLLLHEASRIAARMAIGCLPIVRVVDAQVMPMLWISRKGPTIVLPRQLIDRMSREQIQGILGHEIAHYARRDHLTNLFAFVVAIVFWWNPVVWLVRKELRSTQDVCCDALVLAFAGSNRRAYAEMLLLALEFIDTERPSLPELANGIGQPSSLYRRFEMLGHHGIRPRLSHVAQFTLLALAAALPCLPTRAEVQDVDKSSAANEPVSAVQERVVDICIKGNRAITREKVLANISTQIDRPIDEIAFAEDLRRLSKKDWFVSIDPQRTHERGGVFITLEVVERRRLEYVKYLGNTKIKATMLSKETGLKKGDSLDSYAVEEGRRKIETLYQTKGHNDTKVTVTEGTKPTDRGAIFLITEGVKQKIWKVKFEGNTVTSDGRLKTQMQPKPRILHVFKGTMDCKTIDEDVERLTAYYRGLGFFKAHVGRDYEYDEKENRMALTFVIHEGPRYCVRSISFIGNKAFDEAILTSDLKLKSGAVFDQAKMNADISVFKDCYRSNGYAAATVEAELTFFEEPSQVDLVYQVNEGK